MVSEFGLAARVQGLRRYYALVLEQGGKARLVKVFYDQTNYPRRGGFCLGIWQGRAHGVGGQRLANLLPSRMANRLCSAVDADAPLLAGGIALLVTEGRAAAESISVQPL